MTKKRLLIVGCGDLGLRLARSLRPALWQVSGSRRQPPEAETSIDWIQADHCEPGALDVIAKLQPDYVLATFTPTDRDVPGYRQGFGFAAKNLTQALAGQPVSRIIMASSTRVYAERKGEWVDETSPLATDDERASAIIDAEACFLTRQYPLPWCVSEASTAQPIAGCLQELRAAEWPRRPPFAIPTAFTGMTAPGSWRICW